MAGAPAPLATVQDLADWLGEPLTDGTPDAVRAGQVLAYASMLVRDEAGTSFVDELGNLTDVPDKVRLVTLQVSARGFTNPESWGNERVDDWGGGGRPIEELGMYLTATERSILAEFRPSKPKGIGIMTLTRTREGEPYAGYVPTPDGPPIPWY